MLSRLRRHGNEGASGMTIGQAIRAQRRSIGAPATWLAFRLGVHRNTVANWEAGRAEPTTSQLCQIANAVGCTVADLLACRVPVPFHTSMRFCRGT